MARPHSPALTVLLRCSFLPALLRLLKLPLAYALPAASSILGLAQHQDTSIYHTSLLKTLAEDSEPETKPGSAAFFLKLVVVLCLVLIGGALAGLTLALMSQDAINLEVMSNAGDEKERRQAGKVLKLIKKGQHWVLVTLLLYNTMYVAVPPQEELDTTPKAKANVLYHPSTNETLPIFLDSILGGGVLAVISSTALILLFGEVIPQAICSRYGLAIGAASVPFMNVLMYASYPLSYPIALLLDKVLGHDEGTTYKRKELKSFVSLHRHLGSETLMEDEVVIISAVLELSEKSIKDIMVPIEDIYSLSTEQILDEETVAEILRQGYSRVPVYEKQNKSNFIGMLLIKNLVIYDPEDAKPVSSFSLIPLPEAEPSMSCLEALNFFQQGRSHMMLVSNDPGEPTGALGIVSLEDVIEELIGEEIIDETDLFLDVANKIKVVRKPQIRTGAAKKLTPLLKNAAARRKNTWDPPATQGNGKLSRANSDVGSESSSNQRDYGTISINAGASTPRRRPSGPHRLGSATATAAAFDKIKIKIKGANADLRKQALEAVMQNLEATGHKVSVAAPDGDGDEAGDGTTTPSSEYERGQNGRSPSKANEVTVTSTVTADPERVSELKDAHEDDENAPLLGGKQVVSSP